MNKEVNTQEEIQKLNGKLRDEIRARLTAIAFPFGELEDNADVVLPELMRNLLERTSLDALKVDLEVFQQLIDGNYNLFSITFLLNAVPKLSAKEHGLSIEEYAALIQLSYKLGEIHKKHAKPIQDELQAEYQKKANALQNTETVYNVAEQKKKNKGVVPLKGMKR